MAPSGLCGKILSPKHLHTSSYIKDRLYTVSARSPSPAAVHRSPMLSPPPHHHAVVAAPVRLPSPVDRHTLPWRAAGLQEKIMSRRGMVMHDGATAGDSEADTATANSCDDPLGEVPCAPEQKKQTNRVPWRGVSHDHVASRNGTSPVARIVAPPLTSSASPHPSRRRRRRRRCTTLPKTRTF